MPTFDGGDDFVRSAVQVKRFGLSDYEEAVDGRLQVDDMMKAASLEASLRQLGEEALDGVEPDTLPSRPNRSEAQFSTARPFVDLAVPAAAKVWLHVANLPFRVPN